MHQICLYSALILYSFLTILSNSNKSDQSDHIFVLVIQSRKKEHKGLLRSLGFISLTNFIRRTSLGLCHSLSYFSLVINEISTVHDCLSDVILNLIKKKHAQNKALRGGRLARSTTILEMYVTTT